MSLREKKNMKKHSSLVEIHQKRNVQPNSQTRIALIRNPVTNVMNNSDMNSCCMHFCSQAQWRLLPFPSSSSVTPCKYLIWPTCKQSRKCPCVVLQMHFWWITAGLKYIAFCVTQHGATTSAAIMTSSQRVQASSHSACEVATPPGCTPLLAHRHLGSAPALPNQGTGKRW